MMGLLLLSFMFVIKYGRGNIVQFACLAQDLPSLRSRRYRSPSEWDELQPLLKQLVVVRTNCSHLFFGCSSGILTAAAPLTAQAAPDRCLLLLDLASVRTVDSSALEALRRQAGHVTVLLTGLTSDLAALLHEASALRGLRCFRTLDMALEFCEDQLLRGADPHATNVANACASAASVSALDDTLSKEMIRPICDTKHVKPLPDNDVFALLQSCLPGVPASILSSMLASQSTQRLSFLQSAIVVKEDSICDGMFVCLSGTLTVYSGSIRLPQLIHEAIGIDVLVKGLVGPPGFARETNPCEAGHRIRGLGPGSLFGESTLLTTGPHACRYSVVADSQCEVLLVRREFMLSLEAALDLKPVLQLHKVLANIILAQQETLDVEDQSSGQPLVRVARKNTAF